MSQGLNISRYCPDLDAHHLISYLNDFTTNISIMKINVYLH